MKGGDASTMLNSGLMLLSSNSNWVVTEPKSAEELQHVG